MGKKSPKASILLSLLQLLVSLSNFSGAFNSLVTDFQGRAAHCFYPLEGLMHVQTIIELEKMCTIKQEPKFSD